MTTRTMISSWGPPASPDKYQVDGDRVIPGFAKLGPSDTPKLAESSAKYRVLPSHWSGNMKPFLWTALFILCATLGHTQELSEIIQRSYDNAEGISNVATMKMSIIRPDWQREIVMRSWNKTDEFSLVLITEPAREKGMAFLKRGKEMWNWQPSIDRVIKLPPSMMSQSWMGSDFTNDDLIQQSSIVDDFVYELIGEERVEDRECWIIKLVPKEETAVVWGKIHMWVDKQDYIQLKTEFYDEDDYLFNTMLGKNIKQVGSKTIPTRMEVLPEDEPDNKTIIEYLDIAFDVPLEENFFSVQNMKRIRQ